MNFLIQPCFLFLRYLEGCSIPITVKRKYQFSSNTTSSNSDDDRKATEDGLEVPPGANTGMCKSFESPHVSHTIQDVWSVMIHN